MDPLIATMDQSSIGNKNKILTSGPNAKEQNSKLMHKTDQDLTSPIILSPSATNVVPSSFDEFRPKNNHFSAPNNRCSNNHRSAPLGDADYDDNKDVIIVREHSNKDISRNHKDSGITSKIGKLSMTEENILCTNPAQSKHGGSKKTEGTSTSSQIPVHTIAPNRTSTTTTTIITPPPPSTITSTTSPISRTDDSVAKSRDPSEACDQHHHHQALSSTLPASAIAQASNGGTRGGNHHVVVGGMTALQQQRRQPPIIKAQSLDLGCVDDRVNSHHLNSQYMFQSNHHYHYHRNHLHSQHPHHYHHVPTNQQSSSSRKQNPINIGCSLDNQRSEDEDTPRSSIIAATLTTEDVDADVDEDDDEEIATKRVSTLTTNSLRSHSTSERGDASSSNHRSRGSVDSTSSTGDTTDSSQPTEGIRLPSPQPRQHALAKGLLPKVQSLESRPIYPNVPYSPYASPYGSPRSNRRRTPLRESRRISIEQSGSFLQLNQYKLMDQIGQGSYGLVKLAYSEEDSTHYAMKILSKRRLLRKAGLMSRGPKKTTSPLDRVYREIAVLKKLDHPNVVKLVEVLDDPLEDSLYLVFELVKQGEVLGIPTDKPLTEERAWSVFRDAVLGLEYLHYQRIIHADIKPGNLLLTECGHVKIADLGVCNEFLGEDATMNNGSTAGTPAFRAPETLFPGQHLYSGKAADIWALGATLYSLVYGNVPFVASSVPLLYEKIKNETLVIPEQPVVSEELVDLIKKLLTKDPAKRITLPQIKEHPWMTSNGKLPLPSEDDNCRLVQVSEEDINSVVKSIPKLDTLILIKTMLKNHSFLNPFTRGISGRAPQRGGSRLERFTRAGRSNSAPGAYHSPIDRQLSADCILPALSEHGVSSNNDIAEDS